MVVDFSPSIYSSYARKITGKRVVVKKNLFSKIFTVIYLFLYLLQPMIAEEDPPRFAVDQVRKLGTLNMLLLPGTALNCWYFFEVIVIL